ncbi:hypothetical protein Gorai_006116 [Gossypium raimondii]|uniref:Reverse transcriptase zinc-binding domain-containing protein n=1 Tax=Gossypium raimondii TaxID=29730 RepID=A0A7J8QF93_GOSRA|nr:hypothetical protein [Gossypium raimondii]
MDGCSIWLDRDNWGFEGLDGDALLLPNNAFPEISSIKIHVDPACSRCKGGDKTLFHALRNCPKAQDVLIASGFGNRLLVNHRNNAIFRGKDEEEGVIWERARKLNDDFRIHNLSS